MNNISRTLFLPLAFKALDAQQPHSILNDQVALDLKIRLSEEFDFEDHTLKQASYSMAGTIARAKFFDDLAQQFIQNNPKPVIINMGAGLDSRSLRIWDKKALFFDIDLPEVIALRREYIEDKSQLIATDIFQLDYLNTIINSHPDSQFCFIFEGVLMYFDKDHITTLLKAIINTCQGEIIGDFCLGDFWQKNQKKHDLAKNIQANFKNGFQNIEEILQLNPRLQLKNMKFYHDKDFAQYFHWRRYLMMCMPKKMKQGMILLELKF